MLEAKLGDFGLHATVQGNKSTHGRCSSVAALHKCVTSFQFRWIPWPSLQMLFGEALGAASRLDKGHDHPQAPTCSDRHGFAGSRSASAGCSQNVLQSNHIQGCEHVPRTDT